MPKGKTERPLLRYWPRLLFLIPFVAMLFVSSYNRVAPELGGIPFFYWYQLAWVLIGAGVVLAVYTLETKVTRVSEKPDAEPSGIPEDIL
jgi:Protein of unknown function (DUF3311)